jgi:hypothetical protein
LRLDCTGEPYVGLAFGGVGLTQEGGALLIREMRKGGVTFDERPLCRPAYISRISRSSAP